MLTATVVAHGTAPLYLHHHHLHYTRGSVGGGVATTWPDRPEQRQTFGSRAKVSRAGGAGTLTGTFSKVWPFRPGRTWWVSVRACVRSAREAR